MDTPNSTHSLLAGYLFWILGFFGLHRFYFGKRLTGILWAFTFGVLGVGWLIDLFLIPSMEREANERYKPGVLNYSLVWALLILLGVIGVHRFYMGKIGTGLIYLVTGGLFGLGVFYDILTLNDQIQEQNDVYRTLVAGQE